MPYIKKKDVERLETNREYPVLTTAGELNYYITTLVDTYLSDNGLKYQTINDIVGALEGAKLEFYRRVVAPYENMKIKDNGDVYDTMNTDPDCNEKGKY